MHIVSHRGSSLSSVRHPIHACAPVRCVVVVLFTRLLFLFVPLLFFRPFQMSSSKFHERLKSKDCATSAWGPWPLQTTRHPSQLARSIHHSIDFRQNCHVGNTTRRCRLCLFQDSDFEINFRWSLVFFLEVEHLSQPVGCARNKFLSRTVLQSLKSFLWMLDYVWMGFLLLIFGTS